MTLEEIGLDKNLYKITEKPAIISDEVQSESIIDGEISGNLTINKGFLQSKNYVNGTSGYRLADTGVIYATGLEVVNGVITGAIITGSTITGGTVQTASTGKRIVITSNVLSVYDSDGTLCGTIDGDTGQLRTSSSILNIGTGNTLNADNIKTVSSNGDGDIGDFDQGYRDVYVRNRINFPQTSDDQSTAIYETHKSIMQGGMKENLSSTSAHSIFAITLTDGKCSGGQMFYSVELQVSGGDSVVFTGILNFAAINKGGVYFTNIVDTAGAYAESAAGDSCTLAWSFSNRTNKTTLRLTPTFSVTGAGVSSYNIKYLIISHNNQAITPDL